MVLSLHGARDRSAPHRNRRRSRRGKPASMTSTRMRSSCRAMRIFSSFVIDAPGLCSPSRIVVSNMIRCFFAHDVSNLLLERAYHARTRNITPEPQCSGRKLRM